MRVLYFWNGGPYPVIKPTPTPLLNKQTNKQRKKEKEEEGNGGGNMHAWTRFAFMHSCGRLSSRGVALEGSLAMAHMRVHVCRRVAKKTHYVVGAQSVYLNQRREDACHCHRGEG